VVKSWEARYQFHVTLLITPSRDGWYFVWPYSIIVILITLVLLKMFIHATNIQNHFKQRCRTTLNFKTLILSAGTNGSILKCKENLKLRLQYAAIVTAIIF